jgi:hypothetical protein
VGAGNEHHQAEADVGKEGERRVLRVQPVEPGSAEGDACDQLTENDRQVPLARQGEQRTEDADDRHQREGGERHGRAAGVNVARRQGMSVFSST